MVYSLTCTESENGTARNEWSQPLFCSGHIKPSKSLYQNGFLKRKKKEKKSHRHVLRDSFYLPFTCLTRNAPSSKRNRFSVTIDIKFAHRKDAMAKEIIAANANHSYLKLY